MGTFFVYILKSSICLVAFYLFYRLLLSRETFHRFNRIALLGIFSLSLLIPLCEVSMGKPQTAINWQQLILMANYQAVPVGVEASSISWSEIILLIYLAGFLFFFCRNLYSLTRLVRLLKGSQRKKLDNGINLIIHQKEFAPFSWMKYVAISDSDMQESGREILIHEIAHIQNRHSIDLLLAEFCILFHWFNPAAWLMKQELQNIHEYEADETVLNQGIDAKQYQLLLIKKAVGTRLYSMANSFNHSKLKKRITMMLKEKSNPWARLKYLYILPLAALAVTAFARPEISDQLNEISAVEISDLSSVVKEKLGNNISLVANVASQGSDELLVSNDMHQVKRKAILITVSDSTGIKVKSDLEKFPLVMLDGIEITYEEMQKLNPDRIGSISVLKDQSAFALYGEKGKDGVILITTKDTKSTESHNTIGNAKGIRIVGFESAKGSNVDTVQVRLQIKESQEQTDNLKGRSDIKNVLILIDRKESSDKELNSLNPDDISSVNVLKGNKTKEYGKKAKKGVIVITTKKAK